MAEPEIRRRLVEALEADLVGPFVPDAEAHEQETLPLPPSRWYLTGFLAPKQSRAPDQDDHDSGDEELGAGSETQAEDAGAATDQPTKRPVRFPASMGLSVFLPPGEPGEGDALDVEISYADYDKVEVALEQKETKQTGWKRVPHGPVRVRVPLDRETLRAPGGVPVPLSRGLVLRGELETTDMEGLEPGTRVLSLFVVNERTPQTQDRDETFVFQVKLALVFERGFASRPNRRGENGTDADRRVLALLFREHREWAVGHNTSLAPVAPVVSSGKVTRLETTQLPTYEVPPVVHRELADVTTGMAELAKLDGRGLGNALSPLVEAYGG